MDIGGIARAPLSLDSRTMSPTPTAPGTQAHPHEASRVVPRRPLGRPRDPGPGVGGHGRAAVVLTRWAALPLRAFLGFTYCFAGLQKLANPGFLDAANPASIQSQLAGAARRSPIHALVSPLMHVAVPVGVVIAVAELAVGLGTVLGLWTRLAAAGGMAIAMSLFLTVSFHASPYYTGSDIVFLFAWTPLVLAGPDPLLSLDALVAKLGHGAARSRYGQPTIDRRTVTTKGAWTTAVAALGIVSAGLATGVGRAASHRPHESAGSSPGSDSTAPPTTSAPVSTPAPTSGSTTPASTAPSAIAHPAGTRIGPASAVPVAGAAQFQDPASGDPALVIQPTPGRFLAFDAVCPHAGCIVGYDGGRRTFVCPCHGSEFNAVTGAVETGPARTGLTRIAVQEGSDGQLYSS